MTTPRRIRDPKGKVGYHHDRQHPQQIDVTAEQRDDASDARTDKSLSLIHIFVADGEEGAEVYSGATTEKQAWDCLLYTSRCV